MTLKEAEQLLIEWAKVARDRDNPVRAAVGAGVTKLRVANSLGIGRSTIDCILAASGPAGTINGPSRGQDDH